MKSLMPSAWAGDEDVAEELEVAEAGVEAAMAEVTDEICMVGIRRMCGGAGTWNGARNQVRR